PSNCYEHSCRTQTAANDCSCKRWTTAWLFRSTATFCETAARLTRYAMNGYVKEESPAVDVRQIRAKAPETTPESYWTWSAWGLLLLISVGCISALHPTKVGAPDAPFQTFSSARAMSHVQTIARQPHPLGTSAEADVRRYLLE